MPDPSGLDPQLLSAVKGFEGYSSTPQWDYRQYTSGYGTRAAGPNEQIDQATAEQRLASELANAQGHVDSLGVQMPPGVRNALTSLTHNAGPGWVNSGLGQAVKSGDWDTARQIFLTYNKAGGKELPGLTARRQAEAAWFQPQQTASLPIPPATAPVLAPSGGGGGPAQLGPGSPTADAAPTRGSIYDTLAPPAPMGFLQLPQRPRPKISSLANLRAMFQNRG
jgi:lysozyme